MQRVFWCMVVLAGCPKTGWGEPARPEGAIPVQRGLIVHEWGVFPVHEDVELANADMKAVWAALPPFIYGQVTGRDLPRHWHNRENVDKPVLFFHCPEPVELNLRVDFPGGLPALWWPGTQVPAVRNGVAAGGSPSRFLEWRLRLKEPPRDVRRVMGSPPAAEGSWVQILREVRAEDVFALVGEQGFGYERDRFVYYDGLLPRGQWVHIRVDAKGVAIANRAAHPVFDLTVVDRRSAEQPRVARVARLEAGASLANLAFADADARTWPDAELRTLTGQLSKASLHEDEARALVNLWSHDLYPASGVSLFYRLPQAEYERLLPLTLKPRPEQLVRVGLVHHPHCEPDLPGRVAALARDLGRDDFARREQAQKELDGLGRAGFVHLLKLARETQAPEVRRRLEKLLEKYDSTQGIKR